MACHAFGLVRCSPVEPLLCFPWSSTKLNSNSFYHSHSNVASRNARVGIDKYACLSHVSSKKYSPSHWQMYAIPVGVEELSSESPDLLDDETGSKDSAEQKLDGPLNSDELKLLLADSERRKLVKKLSEANQLNRHLKRQLLGKEDDLVNFKSDLAVMEQEIQALVSLADEIANAGIPEGTRKINGKYIHSHLVSRLGAVQKKLKDQIKDVDAVQSKEVTVFWLGMAESVELMGSFDGWSQGQHMSPDYTSSYTKFSTKLLLRPGRYEIKFLVDGKWLLSSELPTVGEGPMENNLLVVE